PLPFTRDGRARASLRACRRSAAPLAAAAAIPASGSEGPRRVGGRLPSSPGANAAHSSRPPLGGRPRPNFTCRGFLGGKEAPELFKSSVPLLCEGPPGLTECLPLLEEAVVVPGAIEIHVVGEANQSRELLGSGALSG